MEHPLFVLAVLATTVVVSELLVRRTWLKHLGSALVVIVVTATVANLGVIPTYAEDDPLYNALLSEVAYVSIFWLLLNVNLRDVLRAGRTMILLFVLGSLGTMIGVLVGMWAVDAPVRIGEHFRGLGGMFVGTYTGGSLNFNAVAVEYGIQKEGVLYASATVADSLMTTVWMAGTLLIPRLLPRGTRGSVEQPAERKEVITGIEEDTESLHPVDLGLLLALGAGALWFSRLAAERIEAFFDLDRFPAILVLTTLALVAAQFPALARLRGTRTLGMFGVYLFLAVIGALCDIEALLSSGSLGVTLVLFVAVVVGVHGLVVFGLSTALRVDPDMAAVASQANIGGGTSALAVARSLGRGDLVLPAILVGSIGTASGTFLGLATSNYLLGWLGN